MTKYWIAVASANHVTIGVAGGYMQICHGKIAPLRRIHPGDYVAYYSPVLVFGEKQPCQAFTALGAVCDGVPYQVDMGKGFLPYRRDVQWLSSQHAPIHPLLNQLTGTAGKRHWGYLFRFGLVNINRKDMALIAQSVHLTHADL